MKEIKKFLIVPVLIVVLCLSACSAPVSKPVDTTGAAPTDSVVADSKPDTNPTQPEVFEPQPGYFPIPTEPATFTYLSGAGGWQSVLEINADGTFTGTYTDAEMGSSGEGYNATYYVCEFSGVFSEAERIDAHSYRVPLTTVELYNKPGTEWIENNIRYIATEPAGLYDQESKKLCEEYIVYMPNTPVAQLPEEFLTWWPYRNDGKDTLSCFGLLNVATNDGFFYIPE